MEEKVSEGGHPSFGCQTNLRSGYIWHLSPGTCKVDGGEGRGERGGKRRGERGGREGERRRK